MYDALGGGEALMSGRRVDAAYKTAAIDDIAEMVVQVSYGVSCVGWFGDTSRCWRSGGRSGGRMEFRVGPQASGLTP